LEVAVQVELVVQDHLELELMLLQTVPILQHFLIQALVVALVAEAVHLVIMDLVEAQEEEEVLVVAEVQELQVKVIVEELVSQMALPTR
jgi:hypothetical protein